MENIRISLSKKILVVLIVILHSCRGDDVIIDYIEPSSSPQGTALVITGAAARISHEIALVERLHEMGELDDLEFISGTSAGAITALNINRILDPSFDYDWEDFKSVLFSLKQNELFANERNDLPIDTRGAWTFFDKLITDRLKLNSISKDLKYPTCLTAVRLDDKSLARVSNINGLNSITDLPVEGLMTSTSFPVVFPSIRIDGVDYVDGGLVENIPTSALFEYQQIRNKPFKKIIIVSFQKNKTVDWPLELSLLFLRNKREEIIEKTLEASGFSLDANVGKEFIEQLKRLNDTYPDFASRTVVYTPNIDNPPYFPTFQFDGTFNETIYTKMREWALKNNPIPLETYVKDK